MRVFGNLVRLALILISLLGVPRLWTQGPLYQTDNLVRVDLHPNKFYIFGAMDGTPKDVQQAEAVLTLNSVVEDIQEKKRLSKTDCFDSNLY